MFSFFVELQKCFGCEGGTADVTCQRMFQCHVYSEVVARFVRSRADLTDIRNFTHFIIHRLMLFITMSIFLMCFCSFKPNIIGIYL